MSAPLLLILAGPAGSGKSTLCERLVAAGLGFSRVITSTTRAPRPGEVNGVHYHFLTPAQFDEKITAGAFLEWARVHGERRYGTLAASVLQPLTTGQNLVINLDVQGVASVCRAANWIRACEPRTAAPKWLAPPRGDDAQRQGGRMTALPKALPLFPLRSVLFPGGLLSLRIFETRYLDMVTSCLREERAFGVVCLNQGHEVKQASDAAALRFEPTGTLAHVVDVDFEDERRRR